MQLKHPFGQRSLSRGTSLLEALVALLVLALGVLGLTRIHVSSMLESRHTTTRSIAVSMATDMMERMRANPAPAAVNRYAAYTTVFGKLDAPNTLCNTSKCQSADLAAFDLWVWKTLLQAELPEGDGAVFASPDDPTQFAVLIAWDVSLGSPSGLAQSVKDQQLHTDATAVWRAPGTQGTGIGTAACPEKRTCHLVFIRP
ncbi:MAG: type IV pilus modification protein PilV [Burkholderiales bacterium]|nr:MAG: type IV pilus modification protein PilV [Burkholderiales bacterium]